MMDDRLAAAFGIAPEDRAPTVARMLEGTKRTAAGYWLQLVLAMSIATLGLVLGSTAVVIGAMLVSPLMTPIIELGMGLAIGSPLLVVRSAARVLVSVLVVVGSAALLVLLLPFHEVTTEIAARTSPTALDLAIASCCAIAGVYAVIRPGAATASTAAGTAIGIALVPPLCVVGYGIGTASRSIAGGATLLFIANLCGILLFSVVGFLVLGYGKVPVASLERAHAESGPPSGLIARIARRLSAFFSSKLGPLVRVAMPVLLVLAVYWPLKNALAQVSWEVRVRTAAQSAVAALPDRQVHSSVRIEGRDVTLTLVLIGTDADAARLRRDLTERIAKVAGRDPIVHVTAVPDASALERAAPETRAPAVVAAPPLAPAPDPPLVAVRRALDDAVLAWPEQEAGPLLAHRLLFLSTDRALVELVHLGAPLGPTAESMLRRSLSNALGGEIQLRDVALPAEPIVVGPDDGEAWLARAAEAMTVLRAIPDAPSVAACITLAADADVSAVARVLRRSPVFEDPRVTMTPGPTWSFRLSTTGCGAASDAGAPDPQ